MKRARMESETKDDSAEKKDAFSVLLAPKSKISSTSTSTSSSSLSSSSSDPKSTKDNPFLYALYDFIDHPDKHKSEIVHSTDELVIVKDKYPKAQCHYLVLPKQKIPDFTYLKAASVPLLNKMKAEALVFLERVKKIRPELVFNMGFHAVPSMKQLHLHLISDDFVSDALKNKKHWNSFTTKFFVPVDDFIAKLELNGFVKFDEREYEDLLNAPLKSHKTGETFPNIPALKVHLLKLYSTRKK